MINLNLLALFNIETALPHGMVLLTLATLFGFYMAWSIGANDVANAMGTSVGSGALTVKRAVIIAAIMEMAGAVLVGSHVTETVRSGIFDPHAFEPMPLVLGFLSALLAAAMWLQVATFFGWPVSTTHSIVGSVAGVGILIGGTELIKWGKLGSIVGSWVTSPLCGGIIAFLLFRLIQKVIINSKHPLRRAYMLTPYLVFYVGFVLSLVMLYKGMPKLKLNFPLWQAAGLSAGVGAVAALASVVWVRSLKKKHEAERIREKIEIDPESPEGIPFERKDAVGGKQELRPPVAAGSGQAAKRWEYRREFEFAKFEGIFASLMVLSACFLAFAHGANDVANAIGPMAGAVAIIKEGVVNASAGVPLWILVMGGVGIVIGLATWGYKVMETIGTSITQLTPSRGFAANIGAATTIVLASRLGFPISTTHTLVGAVLGIGLARGISSINLRVIRDIALSWLITIPAGALLAIINYWILKAIFL